MDTTRPTIERRAEYQALSPIEHFMVQVLRDRIGDALSRFAIPPGAAARALDVGCGRQPFRKALESKGYVYVGLDVQQNAEGTVDYVCAIDGSLSSELLTAGQFDFVLCTEVLEHVADWTTAFSNLQRLVAPGGRVLITCPHFYILHEEPYDFWRPTLHSIAHFAGKVGFTVAFQEAAGNSWDVLGTFLAASNPGPVRQRFVDRVLCKMVEWSRMGILHLLRSGSLSRRVQLHGPLYLSNIVVLQAPDVEPVVAKPAQP